MTEVMQTVDTERGAAIPLNGSAPDLPYHFLIGVAVRAPSIYNTQPWRFRIRPPAIELYGDYTRALPAADPAGRELAISCGAALYHLRVAAGHFGLAPRVDLLPDPATPDLLARVTLTPGDGRMDADAAFTAILRRRTNRNRYEVRPVPAALIAALGADATAEGAWLAPIEGTQARATVAGLVAEGDLRQWADPGYRREVAAWVQPPHNARPEGIPSGNLGMGEIMTAIAPVVLRTFDLGPGKATRDQQWLTDAPAVLLLGADGDAPADWLATGQALARILLRAAEAGVAASFFNAAIEIPTLRALLADAAGRTGVPQLLLRLGYAIGGAPSQRRPIAEVIAP